MKPLKSMSPLSDPCPASRPGRWRTEPPIPWRLHLEGGETMDTIISVLKIAAIVLEAAVRVMKEVK